ncbi:MAG: J domain-containing protein [Synergistaceae bacterium]|jgi:hypothetical protein|nr:J domain-containing protein [Synergistaceae bacterium]
MAGDYYSILGISRTATREEIQAAYRKMTELYNPETAKENAFVANICRKMEEAREVLIDTEKRQAYDASLGGGAPETVSAAQAPPPQPAGPAKTQETAAAAAKSPASEQELRAFFSDYVRAENTGERTPMSYLYSHIPFVVLGSVLLIDILAWVFGLRVSGRTFGFLFRSSNLTFIGWGVYALLRKYTPNAIFALLYSLFYSIIYAVFLVRIHLDPLLYPGLDITKILFEKTAVYFCVFYLVFFCSTQLAEEGGFDSIRERTFGKA